MSEATKQTPVYLRRPRERAKDAKNVLVTLSAQPSPSFLDIASSLYDIHFHAKSEFREAVKGARISLRKAYNLVRFCEAFGKRWSKAERDRFERIGWTKLSIIAAHVVDKTSPIEQWLKFSETHTARECQLHLGKKPFKNETRCMLLRFDDNQYEAFSKAVLKLGAKQRGKGLIGVEKALISAMGKMRRADLL